MKCLSLVTLLVVGTITPLASAENDAWQQAKQNARADKAEAKAERRSQAVAPRAANRRPNLNRQNFNPATARTRSAASYNPDVSVRPRGGRPIITRRTNMQPTVPNQTADISPAIAPNTRRFERGNRGAGNSNASGGDRGRRNRGGRTPTDRDPGSFRNSVNNNGGDRNWQNGEGRGRGGRHQAWHNRHEGAPNFAQTHQRWHRQHQNRSWWRNHYSRFALFGGGYYYWNSGYWYPAYGYDPYFSTYTYDAPIYGYNDLEPGEVIARVQAELQRLGYDPGSVDGDFGPATREAIVAYQQDNGLSVTGEIDEDTLSALGLE